MMSAFFLLSTYFQPTPPPPHTHTHTHTHTQKKTTPKKLSPIRVKINIRNTKKNTRTICKVCSKLTIITPESITSLITSLTRQFTSRAFIVNID